MSDELKAAEKELVRAVSVATEKLELVRKAIAVGESLHTEAKPKRVRKARGKGSVIHVSASQEPVKARGRKPLFTNEVAANMAQAKRDGITLAEIAKTYGCTVQTASRTIDRLDNGARA